MEYKVVKCGIDAAEEVMNEGAQAGWKVHSVSPLGSSRTTVIITFCKEK